MVSSAHTLVVCVVKGRGGRPGKHGVLKLFSSSFLGEFETHSGSVCPHSGCMCCEGWGKGGPAKHGALKGVFQLFFKGDRATQWFRVHRQWLLFMSAE